jgi:sugar phosphate isomerase/epimerase
MRQKIKRPELIRVFKFGGQAASRQGMEYLAGHDFDFADLNLNELEKIESESQAILEIAAGAGMFFVAHAPDKRLDNDEGVATITAAVMAAERFRPRTITVHPILRSPANTPDKLERKLREIGKLAELASGYGARISLENTAEEAADMEAVLDLYPEVVLTLDIGHGELLSDSNKSLDFIESFPERIGHVHIHDNIGGTTYYEDLHLPLGEGGIDFAPIMAALGRLPGEVTITFEMPRHKAVESREWLWSHKFA